MKNQINEERLKRLAVHLIKGKQTCNFLTTIPEKEIVGGAESEEELIPLIMTPFFELVHLFRKEFYYDEKVMPIWVEDENQDTISSVMGFFGLNQHMFRHLFCPGEQMPEIFGGQELESGFSSKKIGENILELIEAVKLFNSDLFNINLN
ncbi:MAG TPA: hypothetical protein VNX68_00075 [Nitrosopumilaceae archaeon]|jgi:hypothetical protein|nr:hypothetical protein [Nitrosopumilaceae archaeon]